VGLRLGQGVGEKNWRCKRFADHGYAQMHQEHAVLRRFDLRSLAVHALASSYDLVSDEHFH